MLFIIKAAEKIIDIIIALFPAEIRKLFSKIIRSKRFPCVVFIALIFFIFVLPRFSYNKISDTSKTISPTSTIESISMSTETVSIAAEDEINASEESGESATLDTESESATAPKEVRRDFSYVRVGKDIPFGSYRAQGNSKADKEVITWLVLEKFDDKFLVISERGLDTQPYHRDNYNGVTTWEKSTIRNWLNSYFYEEAFSDIEREQIISTNVENDDGTESDFSDYIFLLSSDEASKYIKNSAYWEEEIRCKPLDSIKEGDRYADDLEYGWWWLRDLTRSNTVAWRVSNKGNFECDKKINADKGLVRPAMWISLE